MYGEARSQLWRSCKYTRMYEFRPFAEEVTTLRLGARRRSTGLCVYELQGCESLLVRRGVAYIEFARPLRSSVMQG